VKKNQRFEKPSDMKKRKKNQAIRKHIKEQIEANA
jgi:ribosomal protein S21